MNVIKRMLLGLVSLFICSCPYAVVLDNSMLINEDIQPSDVFIKARLIEEELLTFDLNKKLFTADNITVAYQVINAQPREVFFLAKLLNFKAKRLSLQHTNNVGREFSVHVYRNEPLHVYRVFNEALKSIQAVQSSLAIKSHTTHIPYQPANPTQVYNKTLFNNRLLSILNHNKIQPKDVIKVVEYCYALSLLLFYSKHPEVKITPYVQLETEPSDKTPADVFDLLIDTFQTLQSYAKLNFNLTSMDIIAVDIPRKILPSDVIDLVMALNAELTYLAYQAKVKIPYDIDKVHQEVTPSMAFDMINRIKHVFSQT